jgi:FdhE protein
LENLKKRIQQLKKKRPGYKEMLSFYQKVKEEQEKTQPSLKIKPLSFKKEWKDLLKQEGFPLLEKKDFPLDVKACITLFHSLCEIGKGANPHMAAQVKRIEEAIDQKKIDLKKIFTGEVKAQKVIDELGLDQKVFPFLLHESLKPSIKAGVKRLHQGLDAENWLKGYCPVCGSQPCLALLKGEGGKRYLLCSYCGYEWRIDRLLCPFCGNKEHGSFNYFYAEGEETYRIDTCDKCQQYIKTIDARNIEIIDPVLEDLATLHLDLLASQKGFKKTAPNPWAL